MPARVSSPAFVGRAAELERLEAALARAEGGAAAAVFVGGESGVGKTRLLRELERLAVARGARVLRGDCLAFGADGLPYAPIAAALRGLARELEPDGLRRARRPRRRRPRPAAARAQRLAPARRQRRRPSPAPARRWPRHDSSGCCARCWTAWPPRRPSSSPSRTSTGPTARRSSSSSSLVARPARRAPAARRHLPQRRAAPPPSAAPVPGRGGAPRGRRAPGGRGLLAGRAGRAGGGHPGGGRRARPGRAPARALRGQRLLRRGAARRVRRRRGARCPPACATS